MFRPIDLPRSKPPTNDGYSILPASGYGTAHGKFAPPGQLAIGKAPAGAFNAVLSTKKQSNTWDSRCKSPTSGGGKKALE